MTELITAGGLFTFLAGATVIYFLLQAEAARPSFLGVLSMGVAVGLALANLIVTCGKYHAVLLAGLP